VRILTRLRAEILVGSLHGTAEMRGGVRGYFDGSLQGMSELNGQQEAAE
jgi:hypothetical protein